MKHDTILNYIDRYITLSDPEIELFKSLTKVKKSPKRQVVTEAGEVCLYEKFVSKGCLRCYYLHCEGNEHTVQFAVENRWISDFHSFLTQSPAQFRYSDVIVFHAL